MTKRFFPALLAVLLLVIPGMVAVFMWPAGSEAQVPDTVRVGLAIGVPSVVFRVEGKYRLINASTGESPGEVRPGEEWAVELADGLLRLTRDGVAVGSFRGSILLEEVGRQVNVLSGSGQVLQKEGLENVYVQSASDMVSAKGDWSFYRVQSAREVTALGLSPERNLVTISCGAVSGKYRGSMEFRVTEKGITVINQLPVEKYLYGVVPSEMPSSWPQEALKAQAVAARSYLLAQMGSYASQGFDVMATQASQVYRGYTAENPVTSAAVDATRGEILVYQGRPVAAYFHSSSGGFTENSEDVWKDVLPYIRGKEDPADRNDRHYNWSVSYTQEDLLKQISKQWASLYPGKSVELAKITDLEEVERTASGMRVKKMLVRGLDKDGQPVVLEVFNADRVRILLGLRSALFTMKKEFSSEGELVGVTFSGNGWGHGLGMSQWGALGLAKQGYNYRQILQYYYTGVELVGNYGG